MSEHPDFPGKAFVAPRDITHGNMGNLENVLMGAGFHQTVAAEIAEAVKQHDALGALSGRMAQVLKECGQLLEWHSSFSKSTAVRVGLPGDISAVLADFEAAGHD